MKPPRAAGTQLACVEKLCFNLGESRDVDLRLFPNFQLPIDD